MEILQHDFNSTNQGIVDVLGVVARLQASLGEDKAGIIPRDPTTRSAYRHGQAEFFRPEDAGVVVEPLAEETSSEVPSDTGTTEA